MHSGNDAESEPELYEPILGETDETSPVPAAVTPSRRLLVLCSVAGFLVGSGVFGLLWALSGVHAGALEDARAACEALDRVGEIPDTSGSSTPTLTLAISPQRMHRMIAARELAAAAAQVDNSYQPLADRMNGVSRMVLSAHFNDASGQRDLVQAQSLCAQI
jgi:hypothetical protein